MFPIDKPRKIFTCSANSHPYSSCMAAFGERERYIGESASTQVNQFISSHYINRISAFEKHQEHHYKFQETPRS